jgi:hypothetical protein
MDQNQTPPVACTNCQAVTTADGKTLWVCENCSTENHPAVETAPVVADAPEAPITPDAALAQAELDSAAATVSAPIPEIPVVGLSDTASPVMGGSAPPMPPITVLGK